MKPQSTIICPECGHPETEAMPTDACQFFYDCKGCGAVLRPNAGDCCVYCSFGTVPCPPIQDAQATGKTDVCCSKYRGSSISIVGHFIKKFMRYNRARWFFTNLEDN